MQKNTTKEGTKNIEERKGKEKKRQKRKCGGGVKNR